MPKAAPQSLHLAAPMPLLANLRSAGRAVIARAAILPHEIVVAHSSRNLETTAATPLRPAQCLPPASVSQTPSEPFADCSGPAPIHPAPAAPACPSSPGSAFRTRPAVRPQSAPVCRPAKSPSPRLADRLQTATSTVRKKSAPHVAPLADRPLKQNRVQQSDEYQTSSENSPPPAHNSAEPDSLPLGRNPLPQASATSSTQTAPPASATPHIPVPT